jgi:hypothetical protein
MSSYKFTSKKSRHVIRTMKNCVPGSCCISSIRNSFVGSIENPTEEVGIFIELGRVGVGDIRVVSVYTNELLLVLALFCFRVSFCIVGSYLSLELIGTLDLSLFDTELRFVSPNKFSSSDTLKYNLWVSEFDGLLGSIESFHNITDPMILCLKYVLWEVRFIRDLLEIYYRCVPIAANGPSSKFPCHFLLLILQVLMRNFKICQSVVQPSFNLDRKGLYLQEPCGC